MQLDPPISVVTPLGRGIAHFLEDGPCGVEWLVFIKKTGEPWFFRNPYVRLEPDISAGVGPVSPFYDIPSGLQRHIDRYRTNGWL